MVIDESIIYMGIVILGGLILIAGAFFIIKSTSEKGVTRNSSGDNAEPDSDPKDRIAAEKQQPNNGKLSFFSRLRGKMGRGLTDGVKDRPSPDGQSEAAVSEPSSSRMPDLNSLGLQTNDIQSLAERETLSAEKMNQVESVPEASPAPPPESAPLPDTEPLVEEMESVSAIDDSPTEEAQAEQGPAPEEIEIPVQEPPSEESPADNQKSKTDDLFDMFKDETGEESEVSKFAANLDDINAHDLLEQSQNLINYLSGNGGE